MPRLARPDAPGVLRHVMGRGIEKGKLLLRDQDMEDVVGRFAGRARYLEVTTSCINRFIASGENPDVEQFIQQL